MREDGGARSEALGPGEQAHRHAAYPVSLSASGLWSKCLIHGSKFLEDLVLSEYSEACHLVCLTYMQTTSCEMPGCMNHKVESRLLGEI